MKILNGYAGIGGNRKFWDGDKHDIVAVEIDEEIAEIYSDNFPNDEVIVGDAHEYLRSHYQEFDFIWMSPPCPTHSRTALFANSDDERRGHHKKNAKYPDMKLYQEIILLENLYHGDWVIENVQSYYDPLRNQVEDERFLFFREPQMVHRHYFWSNFNIPEMDLGSDNYEKGNIKEWQSRFGFDLSGYSGIDKRKAIRNCVHPEIGEKVLKARNKRQATIRADFS